MNSRFYQWFGKNFANGTVPDLLVGWQISQKHIIRSCTYRGSEPMTTWPNLKHDCSSVLGCLAMVGVLAQIRGLSINVQEKCVALLRGLCLGVKTASLSILPGIDLVVDEVGHTSLSVLKDHVSSREWSSLKSRWITHMSPMKPTSHTATGY